ncbi:hypothetical protein CLOM_g4828 [Closterium sp. NIES-68]|nr:hypothetical protein CLOM_g4828 [Closterium sp. NIES-68]
MGGRNERRRMHVGALAALAATCFALAAITNIPGVARHLSLLPSHGYASSSSSSSSPSSSSRASSSVPRHLLLDRPDTIVSVTDGREEQEAAVQRDGERLSEPPSPEKEERCEEVYGFLPCSTSVGGNAFLMAAYGYIILVAARLISDGSELLLQVLDPGLIGGLFLPMLGAMPDTVLILVSGLGGTKQQAQEGVLVGMGVLAGSTIMIICVWPGRQQGAGAGGGAGGHGRAGGQHRHDPHRGVGGLAAVRALRPGGEAEGQRGQGPGSQGQDAHAPLGHGVTTDEQTRLGAWIMMGTVVPFVIMQVPFMDGGQYPEYQARITALLGMLLSTAGLIAYCAYQVLSPWLQSSKIHYARVHLMRTRALHSLHDLALKNTWGGLLNTDGTPNLETIQRVFRHFDEDGNGTLSRSELKGLVLGLGIRNQGLEQELEEEVEDEEEEQVVKTPGQIYREAILLIAGGAVLVAVFADPVIDSITAFSRASHIPAFFVAFVVTPLASNASELVSSLYFAMKKRRRTISLTYSQVYGAITMNNTLCLGTFLALIYFRGLAWQFSSEVVIILLNTFIVGLLGGSRHTFTTWMAFPVLLLYPVSLAIVAYLDICLRWQ